MPRFSIQPEGEKPIRCDSADQAVQYFANALHHGLSGTWMVHAHVPRFPVHPTRRRGPDELYLSGCGKFALRKRSADAPRPWTVLAWVDGEWDAMAKEITDDMLDQFAVTGTYEEIPGLLKAKYGDMLDEVLIYFGEPEKDDPVRWQRLIKAFRETEP